MDTVLIWGFYIDTSKINLHNSSEEGPSEKEYDSLDEVSYDSDIDLVDETFEKPKYVESIEDFTDYLYENDILSRNEAKSSWYVLIIRPHYDDNPLYDCGIYLAHDHLILDNSGPFLNVDALKAFLKNDEETIYGYDIDTELNLRGLLPLSSDIAGFYQSSSDFDRPPEIWAI